MQTPGYDGWQLPVLPPPPEDGAMVGVLVGRKVNVGRGVNVSAGVFVTFGVNVIAGVSVMVRVKVCGGLAVGIDVFVGVNVIVGVAVAIGMEAIIAEPVALTEETNCVTINTKAISAATIPRDASERLRYPRKVMEASPRSRGLSDINSCSNSSSLASDFLSIALFLSCNTSYFCLIVSSCSFGRVAGFVLSSFATTELRQPRSAWHFATPKPGS